LISRKIFLPVAEKNSTCKKFSKKIFGIFAYIGGKMKGNFPKNLMVEKIPVQKCDYCIGKKRTNNKYALYKIFQVEDKTLHLCRDCFVKFEKTHDIQMKKIVDFSSNPLNIPSGDWVIKLGKYWKSFREFGEENYLDFRKEPGIMSLFMDINFYEYKKLSPEDQKEFQFNYKISQYAPAFPLVILDWEKGEKIGYTHSGEIVCKIYPNEDILLYHRHADEMEKTKRNSI
jgi:hypothetical protein